MKKCVLVVLVIIFGTVSYYTYPYWKELIPQEIATQIDKFSSKVVKKSTKVFRQTSTVEKKLNFRVVGSKSSSSSSSSSGDAAIVAASGSSI